MKMGSVRENWLVVWLCVGLVVYCLRCLYIYPSSYDCRCGPTENTKVAVSNERSHKAAECLLLRVLFSLPSLLADDRLRVCVPCAIMQRHTCWEGDSLSLETI